MPTANSEIHVLLAADEAYAGYAATVIASVIDNERTTTPLHFHVFSDGFSKETHHRFDLMAKRFDVSIEVEEFSPADLESLPHTRHTINAYLRLLAAERLPDIDALVYLDCDLVVLGSISELAGIGTNGTPVAAALDTIVLCGYEDSDPVTELMSNPGTYFNSGVLVLDLAYWRENDVTTKIMRAIERITPISSYEDQAAMNLVFDGNFNTLPLKWNLQVPLLDYYFGKWRKSEFIGDAYRDPGIVHFTTPRKPWKRQHSQPFASKYRKYWRSTPWGADGLPPMSGDEVKTRISEIVGGVRRRVRGTKRRMTGKSNVLQSTAEKLAIKG
ncbi:MAG: glycosyltransferase family 8 protein [Pseudomonadota bacterium]